MELDKNFKEFIELLNDEDVRYLVVGGYSVAHYGFMRFTGDFDIWIEPSEDNGARMIEVLKKFGFGSLDIEPSDLLHPDKVIQLGNEPLRIDLMTSIDGLKDFSESHNKRKSVRYRDLKVDFINLDDLIINKKASNRIKDRKDIEELEKIIKSKKLKDVDITEEKTEKTFSGIKVFVFNKPEFEQVLKKNKLTERNIESYTSLMFISIIDTGNNQLLSDKKNYLTLEFDDVERDVPGIAKTLKISQARRLNKFISSNKDKKQCYIHCSAGVSRSGSIGKYIVDELKGDQDFFYKNNPYIDIKDYFLKVLKSGKSKGSGKRM
ncbi:MAG: nucleotidyltransferase [Ekhidna sp.]|nr:nucleotidyltransferase [Ekhidna sp.]